VAREEEQRARDAPVCASGVVAAGDDSFSREVDPEEVPNSGRYLKMEKQKLDLKNFRL
jgi:hypothetical protein